ncbi:hypothetical protein RvY_04357 [Ramazzottius varieornatus]|uniref:Uncharacterized protein n=1 Tax=Ramazzottius varieornatus TaxID=947166 RepID=A0A1D1V0L4_RAMVA|nr:hypothetical protein RvY_04357 [Ramazzottius varieornatus]
MDRRKSKKLGDPSATAPRSRPTSGMMLKKRQNEAEQKTVVEAANPVPAAESQNPVLPLPGAGSYKDN